MSVCSYVPNYTKSNTYDFQQAEISTCLIFEIFISPTIFFSETGWIFGLECENLSQRL